MLGGKHIQFPWERRRGEATKNKATRWKHSFSSYYLSSYTVTFVLLFWSRNRTHTLVAIMKPCQLAIFTREGFHFSYNGGWEQPEMKHSHLILKEAFVEWSTSPVNVFRASHSKFPASSRRSTAVNLRLLPSWKRLSPFSMRWPLWSQPYLTSDGSLTSQRSMALRPCKASWDLGSLVNWMAAAWTDRTGRGEGGKGGK